MLETPVVATLIGSSAVDTTFNLRRINPKQLGFEISGFNACESGMWAIGSLIRSINVKKSAATEPR